MWQGDFGGKPAKIFKPLRVLFTATAFLSAFLLFLVQPMAAKAMLPLFGGAPAVWLVSMVFFQAALLAGYAYAHYFAGRNRKMGLSHLVVFILGGLTLLAGLPKEAAGGPPAWGVIQVLTLTVGATFFVCAAHAPLLQKWYSRTTAPDRDKPYYLYAASNLGSFASLLLYPTLIEPNLSLGQQHGLWSGVFLVLFGLVGACWSQARSEDGVQSAVAASASRRQIVSWLALSAVPSALLMGVINYLTQNVAPVPFLWVVPMSLYLLTFVIAFSNRRKPRSEFLGRVAPIAVTPLLLPLVLEATEPLLVLAGMHLITVFILTLMCHTRLAEEAPPAGRLTEFYLWVSVGGVIGGIFVAFIAPMVFNQFLEYPLALVAACFLRKTAETSKPKIGVDLGLAASILGLAVACTLIGRSMKLEGIALNAVSLGVPAILTYFASARAVRYGLSLMAFLLAALWAGVGIPGNLILAKRSFFGVHRVVESKNETHRFRTLVHGNTIHGRENLGVDLKPLTYYYPNGPIGQVFEKWVKADMDIGMVGLGVGSQAWYGKPGQRMTYFEIDPAVIEIAENRKLFSFLSTCKADLKVVPGDARLTLAKTPQKFDLLVLDAFSSDSVPMHLLTVEALALFRSKLKPGGIIAYHVSNRYLALKENVAAAAQVNGLVSRYQLDVTIPFEDEEGKTPSQWMILAQEDADFGELLERNQWEEIHAEAGIKPWRDDFSNLLEAFLRKTDE